MAAHAVHEVSVIHGTARLVSGDELRERTERNMVRFNIPKGNDCGWLIVRRGGNPVGPFYTRADAEPYVNPGDTILPVRALHDEASPWRLQVERAERAEQEVERLRDECERLHAEHERLRRIAYPRRIGER